MVKNIKTVLLGIAITAIFIAAITGAYFGYKRLAEIYTPSSSVVVNENQPDYSDFSVSDRDGNFVKLSDYIGKPIVVNFWSSRCAPCVNEMPHFDKLAKEYDGRIMFFMVNVFDAKKTRAIEIVTRNGYTFPLYFDENNSAVQAYNVVNTPSTLFITAEGKILANRTGEMSEIVIRNYLDLLLREKQK